MPLEVLTCAAMVLPDMPYQVAEALPCDAVPRLSRLAELCVPSSWLDPSRRLLSCCVVSCMVVVLASDSVLSRHVLRVLAVYSLVLPRRGSDRIV